MANFILNSTARFRPFSFQEMLAPVSIYTKAYNEVEDGIAELAAKANVWEGLANEQTDKKTYAKYKSFADELNKQAELLSKEGLNPSSRQNMFKMKQRYSSDIVPIENAYKRRQELIDEQRKLRAQDNTMMFNKDASTISLDELIDNPNTTYLSYSGANLAKQVGTASSALAKEMRNNPRKWDKILGGQYYQTMTQKGYRPEEIILVASQDKNAPKELRDIVNKAIYSSGIANWGDTNILKRAYEYANQGLWNAVGETQYQTIQNQDYLNPIQRAQLNKILNPTTNNIAINPLNIYSSKEQSEVNSNIKKYSKYFKQLPNGQTILTPEGENEFRKIIKDPSHYTSDTPSEFRKFMLGLGVNYKLADVDNFDSTSYGNAWNKYLQDNRTDTYDTNKVTEFDYAISGTQQDDMKDAIMTANRGLTLKEVDYDNKFKSFKPTGEELTMEDLKNNKYKVTATRFSPYGNTVMIQDDKGNVRRFKMPSGINTTNESNRDRAMQSAYNWQQVINTGKYTDNNGKTRNATPEELAIAQERYMQALQQAYMYHSQLGVQNKVKEQEFNPYGY